MSNIDSIIAAVPQTKIPPLLVDARAFKAAASELLNSVKVEQAPDLNSVTLKTLVKTHAQAVEFEVARDVKVKHAEALVKIAVERTGVAEQVAASRLEGWFAEKFDTAVKVLTDIVDKQGGIDPTVTEQGGWQFDPELAELREALGDVGKWGRLRTCYVYRFESQLANVPMSIPYELHSRCAVIADQPTAMLLQSAANRFGHLEAGYWLAALQTPGVEVCWQTTAQQCEQPAPANVTRERERMAAELASKTRATARSVA